jgi:tetratricopeptide (TPR) repeat protein
MARTSSSSPKPKESTGRWVIHPMPSHLREQYALPKTLPVPRKEVRRLEASGVAVGEMARWIGKFLEEHPDSEDAWTYRAVQTRLNQHDQVLGLLQSGQLDEAIVLLRQIISEPPGDARAKYHLGTALFQKGEAEEALKHLNDAATAFGNTVSYNLLRARVLGRVGQVEEMRRLLSKLMEQNPGNAGVQKELVAIGELIPLHLNPRDLKKCRFAPRRAYADALIKEAQKHLTVRKTSEVLKLAKAQYDERRYDIASLLAARVMELEPGNADANHYVGLGELLRDQPVNAEKHLRKALESKPGDPKISVTLARALHRQDRVEEAAVLLLELLDADPNLVEAGEILVLWQESQEQRQKKAEELASRYPDAWLPIKLLGDLAFSAGNIHQALELHRKAWGISPSDDAATMILHELDSLGRGEDAVAFALDLKDLDTRSAALRWNAANVCIKTGRLKPAVKILEAMIIDKKLPTDTRFNATLLLSEVFASSRVR